MKMFPDVTIDALTRVSLLVTHPLYQPDPVKSIVVALSERFPTLTDYLLKEVGALALDAINSLDDDFDLDQGQRYTVASAFVVPMLALAASALAAMEFTVEFDDDKDEGVDMDEDIQYTGGSGVFDKSDEGVETEEMCYCVSCRIKRLVDGATKKLEADIKAQANA